MAFQRTRLRVQTRTIGASWVRYSNGRVQKAVLALWATGVLCQFWRCSTAMQADLLKIILQQLVIRQLLDDVVFHCMGGSAGCLARAQRPSHDRGRKAMEHVHGSQCYTSALARLMVVGTVCYNVVGRCDIYVVLDTCNNAQLGRRTRGVRLTLSHPFARVQLLGSSTQGSGLCRPCSNAASSKPARTSLIFVNRARARATVRSGRGHKGAGPAAVPSTGPCPGARALRHPAGGCRRPWAD